MDSTYLRSKNYLMKKGYHVGKTETWNAFSHTRKDLFNVFDGIAVSLSEKGILGFQTTTKEGISARRNKALIEPALLVWLHAGGRFEIHGWYKIKGSRKWDIKIEQVIFDDINNKMVINEKTMA